MEQFVELYGYKILPQEIFHIEKHKYFMSVEACQDVGLEAAVSDWFCRIREDFALWFNAQDISEQKIALHLHIARLKKRNIKFEESEEILRFAENWRMEHPRIPVQSCGRVFHGAKEVYCEIDFFSNGKITGTEIEKKVCLEGGVHMRPSAHLYTILNHRHDVRIFLHNRNVENEASSYPQFIYTLNGKYYFDTSRLTFMEFLGLAAIPTGETIRLFVESGNESIIRNVCRDLTFLDSFRFFSQISI